MNECGDMPDDFEFALEKVRERVRDEKMKIRFTDHVGEHDAACLLGYASGDALRKQKEGRILNCILRGNRRFYSLRDIALVWCQKN